MKINEPTGTNEGFWSDDDFLNVINEAQEDFAIRTKCLKVCATFTTTADTDAYDISKQSLDNFIDIAEIYFYSDSDTWKPLTEVSRDELDMIQGGYKSSNVYPDYYCFENNTIYFNSKTPADYTVKVWYYKLPDTLTGDNDESGIDVNWHQALIYFVCWKFCEADDLDVERAAYFKNEYFGEVQQARMVFHPPGSTYGGIKDDTTIPYYA
jgi:hypothetical protein